MPNRPTDSHAPYTFYKSDISYFSGKMEAYLKYKGIPYQAKDIDVLVLDKIAKHTGVKKMPALKTSKGQWLFDTTPMMMWFEQQYTHAPILSDDPPLRFLMLLLEDYADEWLWRPAMWWRWMPRISAQTLGLTIGKAFFGKHLAPVLGKYFAHRQKHEWLWKDGMTKQNSHDIKNMMFREFELLESVFKTQAYLFGDQPSAADFGYFASMFRHFGNDPVSAEVMRRQAPYTYDWLARLWNQQTNTQQAQPKWNWPQQPHWLALFDRINHDYLPYLQQNAQAYMLGKKRFNHKGKTFLFNGTVTTQYRVYCLHQLQQAFKALDPADQDKLAGYLSDDAVNILLADQVVSGLEGSFTFPKDSMNHRQSLKHKVFGQARN